MSYTSASYLFALLPPTYRAALILETELAAVGREPAEVARVPAGPGEVRRRKVVGVLRGSRVVPEVSLVNTMEKPIVPHNILLKSHYHCGILFDMPRTGTVLSSLLENDTYQF